MCIWGKSVCVHGWGSAGEVSYITPEGGPQGEKRKGGGNKRREPWELVHKRRRSEDHPGKLHPEDFRKTPEAKREP